MTEQNSPIGIQNFNLFGESTELPDVVHCETIEDRSKLHNWELVAHRHARLHQFLLIVSGSGDAELDGRRVPFGTNTCINVPVGIVHGFSFSPSTQGWVLTVEAEIIDQVLIDTEGLRPPLSQPAIFTASPHLKPLFQAVFDEYRAMEFARAHLLRTLSGTLAGLVARHIASSGPSITAVANSLLKRFQDLVERHYTDHWPLARYADALAVSPGHLSRVSRQATGRSASHMVETRLIREARRLLVYTNMSISEVAFELGFIDPAYFSRVFSRSMGISPRRFRAGYLERSLPGRRGP